MGAILALHGLAAVVVVLSGHTVPAKPKAEPIRVTLEIEQRPATSPRPKIPLQAIPLPSPVVPMVSIDIAEEPPVTISVAKAPETSPAPVSEGMPILATSVEWVRRPVIAYPPEARRARATGAVQVRALVEMDGHVGDARVHRSSGYALLDRAACDSVRGALFKPYTLNGVPRSALVIVPIDFSLTIRTASR